MSDGYYIPAASMWTIDFDGADARAKAKEAAMQEQAATVAPAVAEAHMEAAVDAIAPEPAVAPEDDLSYLIDDQIYYDGDDDEPWAAVHEAPPIPHDDFEQDWDRSLASIQI